MTGYLRLLTLLVPALSFGITQAQPLPDSISNETAETSAIAVYHNFMGAQSRLFNGREHVGFLPMTGHPYFETETPQPGTLLYEGLLYQNFSMLYDIVRDEVVIVNTDGDRLSLWDGNIKAFFFLGHHFIRTASGYYDMLCTGRVTLLAKRSKTVVETIESMQVARYIADHVHYEAIKDGRHYSIGNLRSLVALMKDKKKEIGQDLRRKKLKYRKQPEQALVEAANYYNQSFHQ